MLACPDSTSLRVGGEIFAQDEDAPLIVEVAAESDIFSPPSTISAQVFEMARLWGWMQTASFEEL
jgi:hypothetical protein